MRRAWKTRILLAALAVVAASACGDDGGGPSASLDPDSGPAGTEVTVEVSGCDEVSGGSLLADDGDETEEIADISFDGGQTGSLTIPDDIEPGSYRVVVRCINEPGSEDADEGVTRVMTDAEGAFEVTG